MGDRWASFAASADLATRYGAGHPDDFGGVWVSGDRLQVGFVNPDVHEAALLDLLRPLVDVVAVSHTAAELREVCDEVLEIFGDGDHVLERVGVGARTVHIGLRADGVPVAHELLRRYGDVVEVTVGRRPYPPSSPPGPRAPRARKRQYGPTATADRPDLELTAVLETRHVRPGQDFRGRVQVRNIGPLPATLSSDEPLEAIVLDQHGRLAGTSTGANAGTGIERTLRSGEVTDIAFYGGTAGYAGYTTPPGEYRVVVPVPDHTSWGRLLTPPIPLHLLEKEPPP